MPSSFQDPLVRRVMMYGQAVLQIALQAMTQAPLLPGLSSKTPTFQWLAYITLAISLHPGPTFSRCAYIWAPLTSFTNQLPVMYVWLQEYLAASDSLILQTSLSADCLLQPPINAAGPGQQPTCSHRHQAFSQQSKAPHQEFGVMPDSETDENKPPLPFNVSKMPASLTERVRQQAKTRVSRVRVVRKAAANTGSVQSASLDFGKSLQPLAAPSRAALNPKGITSVFQLSWPPPAAMVTVVGVAPTTEFPVSFTGVPATFYFLPNYPSNASPT